MTGGICPQIGKIRETMMTHGALGAMMSGSGPTVFGLFDDKAAALEAKAILEGMDGLQLVCLTDLFLMKERKTDI